MVQDCEICHLGNEAVHKILQRNLHILLCWSSLAWHSLHRLTMYWHIEHMHHSGLGGCKSGSEFEALSVFAAQVLSLVLEMLFQGDGQLDASYCRSPHPAASLSSLQELTRCCNNALCRMLYTAS